MPHKKEQHVYIIGIGGKGLNSIAEFCLSKGFRVSGSDIRNSPEIESLRQKGVMINLKQRAENISSTYDLIVYSSIIPYDHPELIRARELGIETLERAEFLGMITKDYFRISVAGSHGKSTTSALATLVLRESHGSVNSITGSHIKELSSYQSAGEGEYCVLEACEFGKSFLHIPGDVTLITSLEKSHMEFFGTEENMNDAFREFIHKHKRDAVLIINGDCPKLRQLCAAHPGRVVTCGFNDSNEYVIKEAMFTQVGGTFSIYQHGNLIVKDIQINIPGSYNMLNACLIYAIREHVNYSLDSYRKVMKNFTGVGRRFEISTRDEIVCVDDFAHHPTQVKNLINGLKQFFPARKILAVFEPRQYHLVRTFIKEYGKAFRSADEVVITDIVPALGDTERDISSLNASDVLNSVRRYAAPVSVRYGKTYDEIAQSLQGLNLSEYVIATIGAGGIYRVRDLLLNKVQ